MTTTTFAYRDPNEGARIRFRTILERLGLDERKVARAASVHGRRTGRIWAGTAGILAMTAVAVGSAAYGLSPGRAAVSTAGVLTVILLGAWPAMAIAYLLGRAWSAFQTMNGSAVMRETENACADVARLEAGWRSTDVQDRAEYLERGSLQLPLVALALLSPLTIHWIVCAAFLRPGDFDGWIMMSLLIVGHAHLVLAWLGARFVKKALTMSVDEVQWARSKEMWAAFGYTVLASAIPGAILFLIPPILTAVTGILVAPLMFHLATHWISSERRLLHA